MITRLLDLLWPSPMPTPKRIAALTLSPIRLQGQSLERKNISGISVIVAAGPYRDPQLREAIRAFKYHRIRAWAPVLATLMTHAANELLADHHAKVLCPVPLHWTRKRLRGFNQSAELARSISQQMHIPCGELLMRIRATGWQSHRSHAERKNTVQNAFRFCGEFPVPKTVILVDDICTTGSTLMECAKALNEAGVQDIQALVCALG